MIRGIGTDILRIVRLQELYKKYPSALPKRILRPNERKQLGLYNQEDKTHSTKALLYLASIWTAKEAVYKAFTPSRHLTWQDVELNYKPSDPSLRWTSSQDIHTSHDQGRTPVLRVFGEDGREDRWEEVHVSLSWDGEYAVAYVVREVEVENMTWSGPVETADDPVVP
ncbi:4'-phosphopantetheinyl transferase [Saitoella complicata NRRL Y-17804]|uniref:4'-phosphopantetheinyl transferase domain-containing protein n=1 Tax=Saitoella complicata (strain BCRC 22490 / CBS 7301 / JCM 7358 / NBRC 10748 / NRRL Y-17804) TaxID=698492 RepID=A0A0E9NMZ0_SAICN|nr:4'-phosphopantetheinyl transferase [Saitoella complicata NRRL Y-17804]ODQ53498.1 4'-phosphopantetheinyl transferase [Saitoella complicata NRRL Y-17804]GAO51046.1 hypothetical protein G7K_5158-t1 [Saitoella complicata NRRL Y-17804]